MSYYEKYLKYKNKYLELKNQTGGNYTLNLKEWVEIENSGQQNCGIFLSSVYPKYLLKCGTNSEKISWVNQINDIVQLFPKIIDNTKIDEHNYTTMQKLDGDITSIFFNLIPKIILAKMLEKEIINEEQKENLLIIFEGKISNTKNKSKSFYGLYDDELTFDYLHDNDIFLIYIDYLRANPERIKETTKITIKGKTYEKYNFDIEQTKKTYEDQMQLLRKIQKIMQNITFELYENFMKELTEMWNNYYEIITKEIIKIKLILQKINFMYVDNKLDNYGYILSVTPIIDDYRNFRAPKIFNQYLYVYLLDHDSGLDIIRDQGYLEDDQRKLIREINSGMDYYSVNGQYPITRINASVLPWNTEDIYLDFKLLGLNDDVKKILETTYTFDIARFIHNFTNIDEIKNFVSLSL